MRIEAMSEQGSSSMFPYSPLDPNHDSIRLVVLEPSESTTPDIRCRLHHVTFREKTKYEALSYTWGDKLATEPIYIDGRLVWVGLNLREALDFLRDKQNERVLWIDAICINQADIQEKNRQLSIMPYIYTRAQTVVVWLGCHNVGDLTGHYAPYSTTAMGLSAIVEEERAFIANTWQQLFGTENVNDGKILGAMCNKPYWSRLWIIQEICLARRVQICYGANTVEWGVFIKAICRSPLKQSKDNIPMKLHRQLSEKYKNGHKLQNLLEIHQKALCKEPRDHIYGFVGLATDCVNGFPLDYQKSLFEVWKDTVMYKNADHESSRHDIMKFGSLVERMLGGSAVATVGELSKDIGMRMALLPPKRDSLHLSARLSGRIRFLGPTYEEIIGDLKKTAAWKSSINLHAPTEYLAAAREESDMFLEVLDTIEDEDLDAVVNFDRDILWKTMDTSTVVPDVRVFQGDINWDEGDMALEDCNLTEGNLATGTSDDERLFLLSVPSKRFDSPGIMGLAPPATRVGDYILQVQGVTRALVVRNENRRLTVVGTAVVAENHDKGRLTRETHAEKGGRFRTPEFEYREAYAVEMVLDVAIAYHLLLGYCRD